MEVAGLFGQFVSTPSDLYGTHTLSKHMRAVSGIRDAYGFLCRQLSDDERFGIERTEKNGTYHRVIILQDAISVT